MSRPLLFIGNKNYSSWSMRPWLALKHAGVGFDEQLIALDRPDTAAALAKANPLGLVPALRYADAQHGEIVLSDSLAICEWAAERAAGLWPGDPAERALARSAACAMHAGFADLRREAPMNLKRRTDAGRMTVRGLADAAAMEALWLRCLDRSSGPFLFGPWSIADAIYTPAATRFRTYAIPASARARAYIEAVLAAPEFTEWEQAALAEPWSIPATDEA